MGSNKKDNAKVKAKTRQEIAAEYGINRKTFYQWLKKANIEVSKGILSPSEQVVIYEKFGDPNGISE